MPQGAPGRKSFVYIPEEKKHFWREEALKLRQGHAVLACFHLVFILTDFFIYDIEISAIVFDVIFLWLNFYNYMTLNKIVIGIQVALYALAVLIAMTHIKRVFFDIDYWTPLVVYII